MSAFAQRPQWGGGGNYKKGPSMKGNISGELIDTTSGAPIEFATIVLLDAMDREVDGVISDEDGRFKMENVKTGKYSILQLRGFQLSNFLQIGLGNFQRLVNVRPYVLRSECRPANMIILCEKRMACWHVMN